MKGSAPQVAASLSLALLLASCGQTSTANRAASAPPTAAPAGTSADTYAARQALLPTLTPEPAELGAVTDLSTALPGGRKLSAQAVDKSVPIILVHGMTGFGRDEMGGLVKYWGGFFDVQEDLKALGYQVYTASVGPFSSNWDRAAELYAQIKGGCVDYGAAHSAEFGHTRNDPAKCYPGFYPQWDAGHPVNLIGHSMGGPTSRLLVKLLDDGSPANAAEGNLYTGRRAGWVRNVMTISSPNDGSPAADNLQTLIPELQKLIVTAGGLLGANATDFTVYDFDAGQWGLKRQPGESLSAYADRVAHSRMMTSKDSCAWDLRPDGAKEQNVFIGRSKVTRYFSWATSASHAGLLTGWHYPDVTMSAELLPTAYPFPRPLTPGMGNVFGKSAFGGVTYDSSWWENDGIAPSNYMDAPIGQPSEAYTGQPTQNGRWYRLGKLSGWDHLDITGNITLRGVRDFYRNQAAFLSIQN
ncbi:lipase [Deinococcus carri]|uniref:triacylglycerol lipase n=1 Tax=Deinococcus carri TaxID=1211323 RepID=A0ABP9W487_9DEIO